SRNVPSGFVTASVIAVGLVSTPAVSRTVVDSLTGWPSGKRAILPWPSRRTRRRGQHRPRRCGGGRLRPTGSGSGGLGQGADGEYREHVISRGGFGELRGFRHRELPC